MTIIEAHRICEEYYEKTGKVIPVTIVVLDEFQHLFDTEVGKDCSRIIEVIANNSVLGMVRQWQTAFYNRRYSQTTLDNNLDYEVNILRSESKKGLFEFKTFENVKDAFDEIETMDRVDHGRRRKYYAGRTFRRDAPPGGSGPCTGSLYDRAN